MQFKDYVITKKLGGGNFGQVYLAVDKLHNQDIAIKLISKDFLNMPNNRKAK